MLNHLITRLLQMNKSRLLAFLFIFSFKTMFSQKTILEGGRSISYKWKNDTQEKLRLSDLMNSEHEFSFRIWIKNQVLEITKDGSDFKGNITNYVFYSMKLNSVEKAIRLSKVLLSSEEAKKIYEIIQSSDVLKLPSDNDIVNWRFGKDGETYIIEYSDKTNYSFKTYWTPSVQGSLPEAIVIEKVINNLSDYLTLHETYLTFKNTLPRKGCYYFGSMSVMCYLSNFIEIGYSGATKLPFGVYSAYTMSYLGKKKINMGAMLQYNFDNGDFHHLNLQTSKWNLFYKKPGFYDFIAYNYQNRKVKINEEIKSFQNHQFKYGLNFEKKFGLGIGLDFLTGEEEKVGGHFYANKFFSKSNISTVLTSTLFKGQINYKAEVFKSLNFNKSSQVRRTAIGLSFEDFINYKDLYFSVRFIP